MNVSVRQDLWILARDMARLIEETPELQRFRETEEALLTNDEAVTLVREYEERKKAVKFSRDQTQAEQMRLIEEFMAVEDRYNANALIQAHWQARTELDLLLEHLNAVITFPLTGTEAPKVRGGNCGSGGGGCGCG